MSSVHCFAARSLAEGRPLDIREACWRLLETTPAVAASLFEFARAAAPEVEDWQNEFFAAYGRRLLMETRDVRVGENWSETWE